MQANDRILVWALVIVLTVAVAAFLVVHFQGSLTNLIGSLITVCAAFIGGYFITRQVAASDRQFRRQRDAKFLAARAAMPLTLAAVTAYSKECARQLGKIYETRNGAALNPVSDLAFPRFPNEAISDFRTLIEYGPQPIQAAIAALLQKIQVQRARLEWVEEWNAGNDRYSLGSWNLEDYIVDAVEIFIRAEHLYEYGRFEADAARPIDQNSMKGGYNRLFGRDSDELYAKLDRWTPKSEPDFSQLGQPVTIE